MSITDKEIERDLISYLKNGNPVLAKMQSLPLDKSLVELGYIDSFGIVDLVTYLENKWIIKIDNDQVQGKSLVEAVKLMRGPVGTSIDLTVRRKNEKKPHFSQQKRPFFGPFCARCREMSTDTNPEYRPRRPRARL